MEVHWGRPSYAAAALVTAGVTGAPGKESVEELGRLFIAAAT